MDSSHLEKGEQRQRTVEVVAAFTTLMHARERGDARQTEETERHLARRGITIRFAHNSAPDERGGAA